MIDKPKYTAELATPESKKLSADICSNTPDITSFQPADDKDLFYNLISKESHSGDILQHQSFAFYLQSLRLNGKKFCDGDHLIGLSFGLNGKEVVAVSPWGPAAAEKCKHIAQKLKAEGIQLFVKKVHPRDQKSYLAHGFIPANWETDFHPSEIPDDVFPEVITDCSQYSPLATGDTQSDIRRMMRKATDHISWQQLQENREPMIIYPSFYGSIIDTPVFPDPEDPDNGYYVYIHPRDVLDSEVIDELKPFLSRWSQQMHFRNPYINTDSFAEPYLSIIENIHMLNEPMIAISKDLQDSMVGVTIAEPVQKDKDKLNKWNLVANFADVRCKGLSDMMASYFLEELKNEGEGKSSYLNWGGAEHKSLFHFKSKFRPNATQNMLYLKYM